jgi:hypothetical protein
MQHIPKWAWILGVVVILWLLFRSRGGGAVGYSQGYASSGGGPSYRSDYSSAQQRAESLQLDQLAKAGAYQDALSKLDLQVRNYQASLVGDYTQFAHALYSGQAYAGGIRCPDGKPRIDPETGRIYCRAKVGGYHFLDGVKDALSIWTGLGKPGLPRTTAAPKPGAGGQGPAAPGGWSTAEAFKVPGRAGVVSPAHIFWCEDPTGKTC